MCMARMQAHLERLGAHILPGIFVEPPAWASAFHKFSFNRISALRLTQFEKVIVMDNDMALVDAIDELRHAPAPAMVHTSAA